LGAIHALGSHFTLHEIPALVVLPTGAGKSAVLMLTPFLLGARRVLVVTPSRLVRDQIARDFASLSQLRRIGALPDEVARPRVKVVQKKCTSATHWSELQKYSVIIGTPQVLSPASLGVVPAPEHLFDTVLIDEGHHSPARTWQEIIEKLPRSRVVLFTATPFRRDRREIKARIVYSYPLRRAVDDGIYGRIRYQPVVPVAEQSPDVAIATAAEAALKADRAKGLRHLLMVRTDSKKRANELARTYLDHTRLNLRVIHSAHSPRTIDRVVGELREGKLDGVLAVSMMGEGFDLPELKIAAIHAPHKSLEVTLQFIGRFARTASDKIVSVR
jgi:superfamily II DNA or RNA helicase